MIKIDISQLTIIFFIVFCKNLEYYLTKEEFIMRQVLKLLLICSFIFTGVYTAAVQNPVLAAQVRAVHARHILVDTEDEIKAIQKRLDNGITFEYLAQKYSKCPSGANGGDLGFFKRGQMVKEFEDAAFSMQPGEISQPVKTQFGWHLIKVIETK